jgi:hypothetical protein
MYQRAKMCILLVIFTFFTALGTCEIAAGNADGPRLGRESDYDYRYRYGAGLYNDAGSPNSPVAFEPAPNGDIINMGTFGGTIEASKSRTGLNAKCGGTGLIIKQMMEIQTFLDAGWDFKKETKNGTEDIWWILEGQDYPGLAWELAE